MMKDTIRWNALGECSHVNSRGEEKNEEHGLGRRRREERERESEREKRAGDKSFVCMYYVTCVFMYVLVRRL